MFSILVVEDDTSLNKMMCTKLRQEKYQVFAAFDGQEALDIMEKEHIDLIISDIMMPKMDGYELLRELRAADYTLPVLTMVLGGALLFACMKHIVQPIQELNEAVQTVADGDFSIRMNPRAEEKRGGARYLDELDELQENLNLMTKELNNMDYMRRDFMSNVSHEIKTPIAAIVGFTEILQDDTLPDDERRDCLTLVSEEAMRLSRLSRNMLEMSRLDNQNIITRNDKVNISEQIRKSVILMSERWQEKTQSFDIDLEELEIESDPDLLEQIWINLIDNAMKYSPAETTLHIAGRRCGHNAELVFRDEGSGIPAEQQTHIFEKFYQGDVSHKKQGSGLGLTIVKRIAELLGGTISCSSEKNQGTTMKVILPVKKSLTNGR